MADKAISDLLYAWLQCNSKWKEGEGHRYIEKKAVKMTVLGRKLGCERRTIAKQMKQLLDKGYVVEEGGYYILSPVGKYYFLVPQRTLQYLLDTRSANVIKAYCYLGNLKHYYGEEAFFTQNSLLEAIGYTTHQGKNHEFIRNILVALANDELVTTYREPVTVDGKNIIVYRISKYNKVVKGLEKETEL